MKIREIRLKQFKRFTDTTITDIPNTARLVLLVGPNGNGKSSLIDAAFTWHGHSWAQRGGFDESYHVKQTDGVNRQWGDKVHVEFHAPEPADEDARRKAVYARTAYRNDLNSSSVI
jgi:predicted ATP-dependent endonuclease of OLD family